MKTAKRKICVITGTRAEYGLLKPVMKAIDKAKDLKLQVVATGMHLLPEFGLSINQIKKDAFKIDARVPIALSGDDKRAMTQSIGTGVARISKALDRLNPDIVVVLGDRFEILAAAIAASYSGRVLAHISGGDSLQAGYDEYTRHAITKISHIHFPSTKKSAARIVKMGEKKKHIYVTGSTALDTIRNIRFMTRRQVFAKHGLDHKRPTLLLVQHSLSTSPKDAVRHMRRTMQAITELGCQAVIIYPNVDPGGKGIIKAIKPFVKRHPALLKTYKNLPFEDYLNLMNNADLMVGNSSSGIIESPAFKLPVVNIGNRQKGRERAENVIDTGCDKQRIKGAIRKGLYDKGFRQRVKKCKSPYGYGRASEKIVKVLSEIKLDGELLEKRITY